MRQLINFFSQKVHLVDSCTVTVVEVKRNLNPMVLLVQEVNLILQLLEVPLIGLLLILLSQLVDVLTTLVELAEAEDFIVSGLNGTIKPLEFLL